MRPTSLTATLAAGVVGAALLASVPGATSAAPTRSSAYGLSVSAGGQQVVPPSPTVESRDGSTQTMGGSVPPEAAPVLAGGVLELSAGDDEASVVVNDLRIGGLAGELPPEVREQLDQLTAACEGLGGGAPDEESPDVLGQLPLGEQPTEEELVEFCSGLVDGEFAEIATLDTLQVRCEGDSGTVSVLGASALGSGVPLNLENVEPGTKLFPENPLVDITLNRQSGGPRGAFTVDGLVVSLGGGEAEAVVGSVTCGEGIVTRGRQDTPDPRPRPAPAPVPQQDRAPVTG